MVEEEVDVETATSEQQPAAAPAAERGRRIDYARDARALMDRVKADAQSNTGRLDRDRANWFNLKFDRGGPDNQWIVWDQGTSRFVRRGTDPKQGGIPEGIPRVVSNVFSNKVSAIASLLDQSEPAQLWKPATDDDEDIATAEVVGDAIPVLLEEIDYVNGGLRSAVNKSICLQDKVALCVWYDTDDKYGFAPIPLLQCQDCSTEISPMEFEDAGEVCPECASENVGDAIDPTGVPRDMMLPKGKMCSRIFESFEVSIPRSARAIDTKQVPWILTHSRYSDGECVANWGEKAKRALKAEGSSGSAGGVQRQYADAMRNLSSPRVSSEAAMSGQGQQDGPVVFCVWHDPINDGEIYLPHGLYAVEINGILVEQGPLPVEDDDERPVKNVLLRTFQHQPGSGHGKPPADDLAQLQISRNLVETLIQLILMHDAAPRTFVPLSVTLEDEITGMPGETIRYRSHVPGDRPQTDRGTSPPEGLYKYLEMIDAKFDELSNLNAVLQGARPEGDPTLGEVEILRERGMSAFSGPLGLLIRFEMDLSRLLIWIAKRSAWSERFRQLRGENGGWEVKQFNASDLNGRVDVTVDPASAWPQSPMMQRLRLKDAFEMQLFAPPAQDPELATKLLELFNLAKLKPSMDVDRKQVARELDRWKAARTPNEIGPPDPLNNLPMHLFLKTLFLKTEEVEQLQRDNPPVYMAMRQHVMMIQQMLAQAAAAQMAAENPDTRTAAEKGDQSGVDAMVESGAITPAGSSAGGVDELVNAGALVPAGVGQAQQPGGPSIDDLMAASVISPAQAPGGSEMTAS